MRIPEWPSRGFVSALVGLAITILAWFGPWLWPAWPAFALLELVFSPGRPFSALSYELRAVVVVVLIFVNVASWGAVTLASIAWVAGSRLRP